LTTLPARRAFNDALFHLEEPYAIAAVDIDHFKRFNDTYGHETGDQVLRLVAGKLANVTGGGRTYRVGGEEFSILFRGKTVKEVLPHLELLRSAIEQSKFHVRGGEERRRGSSGADSGGPYLSSPSSPRRNTPSFDSAGHDSPGRDRRSSDRRAGSRRRTVAGKTRSARVGRETANRELSVTVSIGVAEPRPGTRAVEQVIESADQALYRAKQSGRNRVELAHPKPKRNIAS
jgi:GGDEF domain-containing protein